MIAYYRLTDIPSTNPSPVFNEDKYFLNQICLKSFVKAYKAIKPKMIFICDFCPDDYKLMIEKEVPFDKEIHFTYSGINQSCLAQYDMFEKTNEEYVLFQECDYFHLQPITESILDQLEFVSPYDHPDKYELEEAMPIRIVDDHHFKQTISTTSTFATKRMNFQKYKDTFYRHGYLDHVRWVEIKEDGGKLYSPIPTFATHMVTKYLSPTIKWKKLFSRL